MTRPAWPSSRGVLRACDVTGHESRAKDEDAAAVAALAAGAPAGVTVVMSTQAYRDYRVAGPPFLALADAASVRTESVAWGVEQTLRIAARALGGD